MIILENTTELPVTTEHMERIAKTLTPRDIELIICDDPAITTLNREHRSMDKPTDVLSFPLSGEHAHQPLGTLVISSDHVRQKADELGHTTDDECALLFVHGLLHLLGYDHETDSGHMRNTEHDILQQFDLPDSLIIRTEIP